MKRAYLCIGALLICGIVIAMGCSNEDEQEYYIWEEEIEGTTKNEDKDWMTREYLIENGIFISEEIEQIDVDKLVKVMGFEEGDECNPKFREIFLEYGELYILPEYCILYKYLIEESVYPKWNQLEKAEGYNVRFGFEESAGMESTTMVFDFERGKAYYGDLQSVIMDRKIPKESIELSEQKIEEINQLLSENVFFEWDSKYIDGDESHKDNPDSGFSWNFYVELENGKIYKVFGSNDAPDTYRAVRDGLEEYFEGAEGYPW